MRALAALRSLQFIYMDDRKRNLNSIKLPKEFDTTSPAGANVRLLAGNETGGMIHSTVPPFQTNRAVVHSTVNELWYVLEGHGEIWRKNGNESSITTLTPGVSIELRKSTKFQYRNVSNSDLKFVCITIPAWPGEEEATYIEGIWEPSL